MQTSTELTVVQAIILGIVQGLTEFLPVSSSGHLVLANYYLGWGEQLPAYVTIATNTGTFLAVLIALRNDVVEAALGFFGGLQSKWGRQQEGWRMSLLVILGCIPTVIIGLGLEKIFEQLNQARYVCIGLIITGIVLWIMPKSGVKRTPKQLTWWDAVVGGISQGIAVMPGISRSGSTISAMLWRGASADLAPRFSFLMYLIVSFGVGLMGVTDAIEEGLAFGPLVGMTISSFITGYLSLIWLFSLLKKGQFKWFAPYLWFVAVVTLIRIFAT
ncbi:MAG: undecaprenyl-diphosphate phosphatase [Merismopedia sp. SIO2A8]|nr:undecaprenyl-diphosphate phosphatase [Merismopedia sp. SIO2A8]